MSSLIRPVVIVGNWKMYKTIEETEEFLKELIPLVPKKSPKVLLAVPFTAIQAASKLVKRINISIGAQNMNDASEGAFTGEIAGRMIAEAGGVFVVLGHSERRRRFGETNAFINLKVKRALKDKLLPILCIGETAQQREEGKTQFVLKEQILECLEGVDPQQVAQIYLAYEPIWAIGTGLTATSEEIEKMHQFCRDCLSEKWGKEISEKVVILYGGSVNPENAGRLLGEPEVDGLLVGGASLSPQDFSQIINCQVEPVPGQN